MPLISPDDSWTLTALMVAGTAVSIWMERRYRWAARLSAPVIALLVAMVLSNARVMPAEAPAYDFVGNWLVPLALPLLLLRANVVRIARETGKLLVAFHLASIGTMIGAVLAFALLKDHIPEPAKAAGIMTGSYIGGMVNFIAISGSTNAGGSLSSALIVADNLVMAGLFLALLWVVGSAFFRRHFPVQYGMDAEETAAEEERVTVDALDLAVSLAVAFAVAAVAMFAKARLDAALPSSPDDHWLVLMGKTLATNKFVLITSVSLVVATVFERQLQRVRGAEPIGAFLLFLFLFTIGLPADLKTVLTQSPMLFVFCFIMAAMNLIVALVLGKVCRVSLEDVVLASNASVGGPATAAAMAMSKGWSSLVLPGLLVGLYGYVVGTPLGLLITSLLSR